MTINTAGVCLSLLDTALLVSSASPAAWWKPGRRVCAVVTHIYDFLIIFTQVGLSHAHVPLNEFLIHFSTDRAFHGEIRYQCALRVCANTNACVYACIYLHMKGRSMCSEDMFACIHRDNTGRMKYSSLHSFKKLSTVLLCAHMCVTKSL